MSEVRKRLEERSRKRKELLVQQFGVTKDRLKDVISGKQEQAEDKANLLLTKKAALSSEVPSKISRVEDKKQDVLDTSVEKKRAKDKEDTDIQDEVSEYVDSSTFLKGTQSANPHNDYSQHFVDTYLRPQNNIHDAGLANRFEEYPKLRELIRLKDELIQKTNTPPIYMKTDLKSFDMTDLKTKFDVILIEPPLEEYQRSVGATRDEYWSWNMIEQLEIEKIGAPQSFIWMWCGSSDGLDAGRHCLKKWGYRRCEDICWIKTNIKKPGPVKNLEPRSIFQRTKEHCLMGIKGTVRRSTDGHIIHANVDIDLIIDEEADYGSDEKPQEIFHIIEHFCLGRRRLHIFGRDSQIRPGWLSIGPDLTSSNYDRDVYLKHFEAGNLSGCTEEIERLRPKSPTPKVKGESRGGARGGGRGRGRGGGADRSGDRNTDRSLDRSGGSQRMPRSTRSASSWDEWAPRQDSRRDYSADRSASDRTGGRQQSSLDDVSLWDRVSEREWDRLDRYSSQYVGGTDARAYDHLYHHGADQRLYDQSMGYDSRYDYAPR